MSESDPQDDVRRHEVIYQCALSAHTQLTGLWAATLTVYRPMCTCERAQNDVCPARCLRESNGTCVP